MLMSVTSFFPIYYYARNNRFDINIVYKPLYILTFYLFYLMVSNKQFIGEEYGGEFDVADNYGYLAMMLSVVFLLERKKAINLVMFVFNTLLVFYSMKRGAIIASLLISILFVYEVIFSRKTYSFLTKFGVVFLIIGGIILVTGFSNHLSNRFSSLDNSGRDQIYSHVFEAWAAGGWVKQVFGSGYFACIDLLNGAYAHSDWFEILYDEGLFGVFIYISLFLSYLSCGFRVKRFVPDYYMVFFTVLTCWIVKSAISGVVVGKDSFLIFATIGFILGTTDRNKLIDIKQKENEVSNTSCKTII